MTSHGFALASQSPLPPAAETYSDAALMASRGPWPGVAEHRGVTLPDAAQPMDVFGPDGASGGDVVIFLHGGGWTNGYKEWCGFMAPHLAAQGCLLVAPSYRLAPAHRYPAPLRDTLAVVAAVQAGIERFGGDPRRIVLAGHSAGGQLAALAVLRPDLWRDAGVDGTGLVGAAPISGVLDLRSENPDPASLEARVYDTVLAEPAQDAEASPLTHLAELAVPLLLMWGSRDTPRVRRANAAAVECLEGSALLRHLVPDADHFETHLGLRGGRHPWYAALAGIRRGTRR